VLNVTSAHLRGRHGPDLEVIWPHEHVRDSTAHHANDPLVEVLRLRTVHLSFQRRVNHAIHTKDLIFFGQHGDIVLEGVWDPEVSAPDVRDALVGIPVALLWKCLVDAVVEVLVVGKDDMATDVV
jgi:hypothetical protein